MNTVFNSRINLLEFKDRVVHYSDYLLGQPHQTKSKRYKFPLTIISYYVMYARLDIVQYLLSERTIPKGEMTTHDPPIYFCGFITSQRVFEQMVRLLVIHGYPIDQVGWMNRTLLYHCIQVEVGDPSTSGTAHIIDRVIYLLRKGSNPNFSRYTGLLREPDPNDPNIQLISTRQQLITFILLEFRYRLTSQDISALPVAVLNILASNNKTRTIVPLLHRSDTIELSTIHTLCGDELNGVSVDLIFEYDSDGTSGERTFGRQSPMQSKRTTYNFYMKDLPIVLSKGKNPYTNTDIPHSVLCEMFDFIQYCIHDDLTIPDEKEVCMFEYYRFLNMILSSSSPYLNLETVYTKFSDSHFELVFETYKGGCFMAFHTTNRLASFEMLCAGIIEHIRSGQERVYNCAVFFTNLMDDHAICTYLREHVLLVDGQIDPKWCGPTIRIVDLEELIDGMMFDELMELISTVSPESNGIDRQFMGNMLKYISLI